MNPFVYTDNNPINAIDPDGRDKIFINSSGSMIKIVYVGKKDIVIIDHNGNRNNLSSYKLSLTQQEVSLVIIITIDKLLLM